MAHNKASATVALESLFNNVQKFNKDSKFIMVKAENCTIYIPVNNLDISIVTEFRRAFKEVYDMTQGN